MRLLRPVRALRAVALAALLPALCAAPVAAAASFPPDLRFRTLEGTRIALHFHDPLEPLARRALPLAEELLAAHEARYGVKVPRLQLVLVDVEDEPNGFATPLPFPLVQVRAVAPSPADDFGNTEDWLRLVLSHELFHSVHLEAARGLPGFGRKLLGRAPYTFPSALTPPWLIEGFATFEETQNTAFGRGRNPDVQALLRMAALAEDFPGPDRATLGLDSWPGGQAAYLFGAAFARHLDERHGEQALPKLVRAQSGKVVPYLDDLTARKELGRSFQAEWDAFRAGQVESARRFAAEREADGLTPSVALTDEGVRPKGARVSPDGAWIAYTSRPLDRDRRLRLVRADGSDGRDLAPRNAGDGLSWSRDGRTLVYDELERHQTFSTRYDLRALEVESGRRRWITRGLRATEPDVAADGRIVFVRRHAERSELALVPLAGGDARDLTRSDAGTQWQGPRWSPDGARIAATRQLPGGRVELVLVDPASGAIEVVLGDRARDLEPEWTPDGTTLVFRSDRDGVSNLHALRLADRALWRLTNVLGGAVQPSLFPDGRRVAFSAYSARGYDLHVAGVDLSAAAPATPFADPFPQVAEAPPPSAIEARPYRPALWPRFWSPWAEEQGGEWQLGAFTGNTDALFRHTWYALVERGVDTGRFSGFGVWIYDRWRPTVQLSAEQESDRVFLADGRSVDVRTRTAQVRLTMPLLRTLRQQQSLSVAWRREREEILRPGGGPVVPAERLHLGGVELAWTRSAARRYPYSISPVEGSYARLSYLREQEGLGSDISLSKLSGEWRGYRTVFGTRDALAVRVAAGTTFGAPGFRDSFAAGGFPEGALFDIVRTNPVLLRGYADNRFRGRHVAGLSAEYRVPLWSPERGVRSLPVFLRHTHVTAFFDAAQAWNGDFSDFDLAATRKGVGAALGADFFLGHALPITATAGLARGLDAGGETRFHFRLGLAF